MEFSDLINVLSLVVGLENLELNTQQVDNLDKHLKQQDSILKDEQEIMLKKIIEQNETIIDLLIGGKK